MSINDATNVASAAALSATSSVKKVTKSFANNIITKTIHQLTRKCYKCYYAKSFDQLPIDDIADLDNDLIAYNSGPDEGINNISLNYKKQAQLPTIESNLNDSKVDQSEKYLLSECVDSFNKCGISKWNLYHHRSYGIACSLYENNPVTNTTVGDPIADVYAILTRKNSCILLLADGVNWGPRSRLAARCAVRASMNYLNKNLFLNNTKKSLTTHDLFKIMCRSFDSAQEFILNKKGTMTTLCCSVVVKLKESTAGSSCLWAVCTLSIGDSTAYVFNREKGVFELTYGSRNLNNDRDMRNVGGALGGVYGNKPDVSNLNYSVMYIKENDIVFLVSDGVSDNLDPIVSHTAKKCETEETKKSYETRSKLNRSASQIQKSKKNIFTNQDNTSSCSSKSSSASSAKIPISSDDQTINRSSLPELSPYERYICSLAHMNEILLRNKTLNETLSAQETCAILIEHVMKLTAEKRDLLELGLLEASKFASNEEKLKFQASLREKSLKLRGKLDHASIVAYEVGVV